MNISEYKQAILSSNPSDWSVSNLESGYNEHDSHDATATLKSDLSISISWGKVSNENFSETWATRFPDKSAESQYIDFFYNNNLVYREAFVMVDGGRCHLPMLKYLTDDSSNLLGYQVTQEQLDFYEIFDVFSCQSKLPDYLGQITRGGTRVDITEDTDWLSGS